MPTLRNKILISAIRTISYKHENRLSRLNKLIRRANLSGADLSNTNLSGASLVGAKLVEANFSDANLSNANLSGAKLVEANFSDANLSSANLSEANLNGANLTGAVVIDANISGANFSHANLQELRGIVIAACHWTGHGEAGRQLLGVMIDKSITFFCGCFRGSEQELRSYISIGDPAYAKSRTKALEFVMSCFEAD